MNNFGQMPTKGNQHHRWPPPFNGEPLGSLFNEKGNRFLYIWRNFNDVALSVLAKDQPNRINPDLSLGSFVSTSWETLIEAGEVEETLLNRWVVGDQKKLTPYECWDEQVKKWLGFAETRTDVYVVRYEDLLTEFQGTMLDMAGWLGSSKQSFENATKKVDPAPTREGGFHEVATDS
jgi:hypothetical protein